MDKPFASLSRWPSLFTGKSRDLLETQILPKYFMASRWFGGKARNIMRVSIVDTIPVAGLAKAKLLVTEVRYSNGENDIYQLPVCFSSLSMITPSDDNFYKRVIAKVNVGDDEGYLCDATFDNRFLTHLYELVIGKESWQGKAGLVSGIKSAKIDAITETAAGAEQEPFLMGVEQSNTSIRFHNDLCLKLYRRIEVGVSPEVEMCSALSDNTSFKNLPAYLGSLNYEQSRTSRYSIEIGRAHV